MRRHRMLTVFLIIVFVFLLSPFLVIFVVSFGQSLAFPPTGFTVKWFSKAVSMTMFRDAFVISLLVGVISTVTALVFGIPAAYGLSRFSFPGRNAVELAFTSPVVIPALVIGFSLLRFLVLVGNIPTLIGLLVGHTVILFPYAVRVTGASLGNFDFLVEEAAISLGASRWKSFFKVILPNIRTGILAAFILGFTLSFNNVPISLFLTGPGVTTLPIQMLSYMEYYYNPVIAALSILIILFTVLITQAAESALGLSKYM